MAETEKAEAEKFDVCGYHKLTGEAKVFKLAKADKLPNDYVDSPAKCKNFKGEDDAA